MPRGHVNEQLHTTLKGEQKMKQTITEEMKIQDEWYVEANEILFLLVIESQRIMINSARKLHGL